MGRPRLSASHQLILMTFVGEKPLKKPVAFDPHHLVRPVFVVLAIASPAMAEDMRVYGLRSGALSGTPGAFIPVGTQLACWSLDETGRCWDGQAWQSLYPSGPRHYKDAYGQQVACRVVSKVTHDCWDGSAWYRLPPGQVFGMVGGALSPQPGAFLTTGGPVATEPKLHFSSRRL